MLYHIGGINSNRMSIKTVNKLAILGPKICYLSPKVRGEKGSKKVPKPPSSCLFDVCYNKFTEWGTLTNRVTR